MDSKDQAEFDVANSNKQKILLIAISIGCLLVDIVLVFLLMQDFSPKVSLSGPTIFDSSYSVLLPVSQSLNRPI